MTHFKTFPFKIDRVDESGEFCGYASTFGNIDLGGDVIHRGSFETTLKETRGKIPILDHHNPGKHIGWNLTANEDRRGLFVCGQLNLDVQLARERHSLMKQAAKIGGRTGLSIGYRTVREETDLDRPGIRHLREIELLEYSIVIFPMNPEAGVTRIKLDDDPPGCACGENRSIGSGPDSKIILHTLNQMIQQLQTTESQPWNN
jgi:HK97 family phage prohead protease